jgi:hypothetical protein
MSKKLVIRQCLQHGGDSRRPGVETRFLSSHDCAFCYLPCPSSPLTMKKKQRQETKVNKYWIADDVATSGTPLPQVIRFVRTQWT